MLTAICLLPLLSSCGQDRQEKVEAWESEKRSAFQAFRDRKYDASIVAYTTAIHLAEQIEPRGLLVAVTMNEQAAVYMARDDYQSAEKLFSSAIQLIEERTQQQSLPTDWMKSLCDAVEGLGNIKHKQGDLVRAEQLYARAVSITGLCNTTSKQRQLVYEYKSVLQKQGKFTEADKVDEQFKNLADSSAVPNPQHHLQEETQKFFREADAALKAHDLTKAQECYRKGLQYALRSTDGKFRASAEAKVALFLFTTNQLQRAEAFIMEAMRESKKAGATSTEMRPLLLTLSTIQAKNGRLPQAEKAARLALKLAESSGGKDSAEVVEGLNSVVQVLLQQHQYEKALPLFERSYAIQKRRNLPTSPAVVMHTCWLANVYWLSGKKQTAKDLVAKFVEKLQQCPASEMSLAGKLFTDFGQECLKSSDKPEASVFFQASLKVLKRAPQAAQEIERAQTQLKVAQTRTAT